MPGDVALANGQLRDLVANHAHGVAAQGATVVGDSARVEILHGLTSEEIHSLVSALGGEVYGEVPGILAEALVPIDRLVELEASAGVAYLRPPLAANIPIDPPMYTSTYGPEGSTGSLGQEVSKTNANDWHAAGFTGQGVKIGIIDGFDQATWNSAQSVGEVPTPAGTFCRFFGTSCDIWSSGSEHGVAVAEIIHEMAPGAQIYIADVTTASDHQAAVDYFASQGVTVISRSLTSLYDGPGNGTGPMAQVIDSAASQGIAWINSAGNSAGGPWEGQYWRGSWTDTDNDGWLNFNGDDELFAFGCGGLLNGIRWNDWAANRTDYDVYVYDTELDAFLSITKTTSLNDQGAGFDPIEYVFPICSGPSDLDQLAIKLFDPGSGTGSDTLEIMGNLTVFEYAQSPYSASGPASDSASGGMLSVGAVDPAMGTSIASYSAQGPTNDGRTKPDISAASCVSSHTYSAPDCFNGTSAAAPAASGAAALIIGAGLASSPSQVKNYLLNNATVDRGANGTDNVYGKGELRLPAPPTGSSTSTASPAQSPPQSPTPSPTQNQVTRVWGDNNCSGSPDPIDSLITLRFDGGLTTNTGACPDMGQVVQVANASPHPWGDADCSGAANPVDSLKLLRFDAGLSVAQAPGCPHIGTSVALVGGASRIPARTPTPTPTQSLTTARRAGHTALPF